MGRVFFKLSLGLFFLVSVPVWAMPFRVCGPLLARVSVDELTRLFTENHGYSSPADNRHFLDAVANAPAVPYYFHVENAVLKKLNDKGVRDKSVTGVLEAEYTRAFFDVMKRAAEADPTLKYTIDVTATAVPLKFEAAYSDYKTVRLQFQKTPDIEAKLRHLNELVALQFEENLSRFPQLRKFIEEHCADCGPATRWHVAGVGHTPELAAAHSRLAREKIHEPHAAGEGRSIFYSSKEDKGRLESGIEKVETTRADLQKEWTRLFGSHTGLLHTGVRATVAVPSRELIEVYRRYQELTGEAFLDAMEAGVINRFELTVPPGRRSAFRKSLADFRRYITELDPYMPAIYEMKEILDLGHGRGDFDLVAVDLAGQNARNLHSAMLALSEGVRTPKKDGKLSRVLELTRQYQDIASEEFRERRAKFKEAVRSIDPQGRIIFSGDDGTYSPERELTDLEKENLVAKLAELGTPADFRLIFVRSKTADKGEKLEAEKKAGFSTIAENMEKQLRKELESTIAFKSLRDVLFAIEVVPNTEGYTVFNLTVAGHVPPSMEGRITEAFNKVLPKFMRVGTVKYISPKHSGINLRVLSHLPLRLAA